MDSATQQEMKLFEQNDPAKMMLAEHENPDLLSKKR
jgi:hypothetical protein